MEATESARWKLRAERYDAERRTYHNQVEEVCVLTAHAVLSDELVTAVDASTARVGAETASYNRNYARHGWSVRCLIYTRSVSDTLPHSLCLTHSASLTQSLWKSLRLTVSPHSDLSQRIRGSFMKNYFTSNCSFSNRMRCHTTAERAVDLAWLWDKTV